MTVFDFEVDAEMARREWDTARTRAMFDSIVAAELLPEPSDADMTGPPKWSEVSADGEETKQHG